MPSSTSALLVLMSITTLQMSTTKKLARERERSDEGNHFLRDIVEGDYMRKHGMGI